MCTFVNQHRLFEGPRDLAQYISLALYLTPPPALALSVDAQDLPPDATQVMDMLPILHAFVEAADMHLIWLQFRPEYEAEINALHDPLTQMILSTNIYLKLPTSTYAGSRFLVVLEPMLDPGQTNARVYGTNYAVVASPVGRQRGHARRAPHIPALRNRAAAVPALGGDGPAAAAVEGDSRRAAGV